MHVERGNQFLFPSKVDTALSLNFTILPLHQEG